MRHMPAGARAAEKGRGDQSGPSPDGLSKDDLAKGAHAARAARVAACLALPTGQLGALLAQLLDQLERQAAPRALVAVDCGGAGRSGGVGVGTKWGARGTGVWRSARAQPSTSVPEAQCRNRLDGEAEVGAAGPFTTKLTNGSQTQTPTGCPPVEHRKTRYGPSMALTRGSGMAAASSITSSSACRGSRERCSAVGRAARLHGCMRSGAGRPQGGRGRAGTGRVGAGLEGQAPLWPVLRRLPVPVRRCEDVGCTRRAAPAHLRQLGVVLRLDVLHGLPVRAVHVDPHHRLAKGRVRRLDEVVVDVLLRRCIAQSQAFISYLGATSRTGRPWRGLQAHAPPATYARAAGRP